MKIKTKFTLILMVLIYCSTMAQSTDTYFNGNNYYKGISWQSIKPRFYSYGGNGSDAKWLLNNIPEKGGRFIVIAGPTGKNGSDHIAFSIEGNKNAFFNGNVGIGTTDTKGFKLGVNGKIVSTEIKVSTYSKWADFVFKKGYKIPTLTEVENHIKEKGHLKDIPSAKEVKTNGFFLGEMDSKLLQKIEELTIYTIEQDKSLKVLNHKFNRQQKEIDNQNKKIEELQIILNKLLKK